MNDSKTVSPGSKKTGGIAEFISHNAIYAVLIFLIAVIAIINPSFLSLTSLRDILLQSSTRIIIALGALLIILTGGCDLSAGRTVGLAAVVAASMLQAEDAGNLFFPNMNHHLPLFVPILITMAVGVLVGLLNGWIVAKLDVPPFITTLGTMCIIYGANSIYFDLPPNNSQPIGSLREDFTNLGSGTFLGIPFLLIIAIISVIVIYVVLQKTRFGKNLYAIGGNREAANVSGINVRKCLLAVYIIAGIMYALAGSLESARTGSATNNYGNGYELDAYAACIVGGCSVTGGVGTVPGIVVGVIIFSVINYGLTFVGVNPYWQQIIKGAIIVLAVAVDIRKYLKNK
jgi:methyl-galactoside transport system permease protein